MGFQRVVISVRGILFFSAIICRSGHPALQGNAVLFRQTGPAARKRKSIQKWGATKGEQKMEILRDLNPKSNIMDPESGIRNPHHPEIRIPKSGITTPESKTQHPEYKTLAVRPMHNLRNPKYTIQLKMSPDKTLRAKKLRAKTKLRAGKSCALKSCALRKVAR